jgi:hypothetical protein
MARKKDPSKELKDQRIPIMITASELDLIDDWSFKNRIRSRGEAIRRLCQIGIMFDDNRADVFSAAHKSMTEAKDVMAEVSKLSEHHQLTGESSDLVGAALTLAMTAFANVVLIRSVTGLANNFKGDGDLDEIMREAKEIQSLIHSSEVIEARGGKIPIKKKPPEDLDASDDD